MTQEKPMTHEESLELIQSMINTARNKVADDGFHLILWGVIVIICCLLNYFLFLAGYTSIAGLPWLFMPVVGVPLGILYERKFRKNSGVRTVVDTNIKYLWWSYGAALFLVLFMSGTAQISPIPYILTITGLVTFASGLMLRFRPMIAGGIVFFALTIACLWVQPVDQLLLEALGVLLGYIIPGIILRRLYKSQSDV
ncbi:MAG: hypothetical protein JSS76_01285 [Bacteroidetes bacterium]|nr:hypothetical protein [Bacteroidota bacterium]